MGSLKLWGQLARHEGMQDAGDLHLSLQQNGGGVIPLRIMCLTLRAVSYGASADSHNILPLTEEPQRE